MRRVSALQGVKVRAWGELGESNSSCLLYFFHSTINLEMVPVSEILFTKHHSFIVVFRKCLTVKYAPG